MSLGVATWWRDLICFFFNALKPRETEVQVFHNHTHTHNMQTQEAVAKQLPGARIVWSNLDEGVHPATHLVCGQNKRTEKVLLALGMGIWIVKWDWIIRSMEAHKWLPTEPFEGERVHLLSQNKKRGKKNNLVYTYSLFSLFSLSLSLSFFFLFFC